MHVRDTLLAFEDPRPLEADLLGPEALGQTTPLTEKHGMSCRSRAAILAGGKCLFDGRRDGEIALL
jgi:hypothetical protein